MGTHDAVVVGAGPAGWAAAFGLAQAGLDVAVVGPVGGGGVQVKAESKERASGEPVARSLFGRVGRSFDQASSWVKSLFAKPAATG